MKFPPVANRRMIVTFLVAGVGALVADHLFRPVIKKGLKI